MLFSYKNTI
ncbi:hypothetical protein [Plasmodium yoelii yoelii]|uniref:Uncharacterized protein n=1 Tax=Plasmodium yoelii yoelii TaxID=73239 RepID=Q7RBA8_PLAYO|nr:hypothetical protein [Plasmodium yoelii yoelii]